MLAAHIFKCNSHKAYVPLLLLLLVAVVFFGSVVLLAGWFALLGSACLFVVSIIIIIFLILLLWLFVALPHFFCSLSLLCPFGNHAHRNDFNSIGLVLALFLSLSLSRAITSSVVLFDSNSENIEIVMRTCA